MRLILEAGADPNGVMVNPRTRRVLEFYDDTLALTPRNLAVARVRDLERQLAEDVVPPGSQWRLVTAINPLHVIDLWLAEQ